MEEKRGATSHDAAPGPGGAERERQVTMFNRKAVVVLAGIGAMTVMVVSFAFNTPQQDAAASYAQMVPAEQAGQDAARPNYLASPLDVSGADAFPPVAVAELAGIDPADFGSDPHGIEAAGASIAAESYDPFASAGYGAAAAPPMPAEPERPSARELAFQRAMDCGIRSCPAAAQGIPAAWSPATGEAMGAVSAMLMDGNPPSGGSAATAGTGDRHETFLSSAAEAASRPYVASQVQRPVSPYQIMAGTLIPVTLVTAINSDLPGEVVAQVTRNIYDTQQQHLLIPAGSKVLGRVDNQVGLGQARVNIAWHRIILPNNNSLTLPGFGGVDGQGAAGIRDRVDNHYGRTYLNALLLSAITAGAQLSQPRSASVYANPSAGQVAAGALGQQMGEVSSEMIRRNMQVGPTLEVRPGFKFSVYVSRDLVLEPYDHYAAH